MKIKLIANLERTQKHGTPTNNEGLEGGIWYSLFIKKIIPLFILLKFLLIH